MDYTDGIRILEQHKEKISVTSEDGVTAFSFSLATE